MNSESTKVSNIPKGLTSVCVYLGVSPKIWVLQNEWFIMENPIKMDDFEGPLFSETPIFSEHNIPPATLLSLH